MAAEILPPLGETGRLSGGGLRNVRAGGLFFGCLPVRTSVPNDVTGMALLGNAGRGRLSFFDWRGFFLLYPFDFAQS